MFEEGHGMLENAMNQFSQSVRDGFGASIINEVFEPMITETESLIRMSEDAKRSIYMVDSLLAEARSII